MAKRFLAVFGLVLLYMVVLAAILLLIIVLAGEDETLILIALLAMLVLSIAAFVPFLNWTAKRVFCFKGGGPPVSGAEVRARLQAINEFDAPVMVEGRKGKLVATWKYVDARWWEILAKAGLTRVYELHIKFDDARHQVTLVDISKSVSWGVGPAQASVSGGVSLGIMWSCEVGKQWGIKENFELGKVYDYRFVPDEIKLPIMNSILRSGWDVRFGIW